jgi:hypothetical protein
METPHPGVISEAGGGRWVVQAEPRKAERIGIPCTDPGQQTKGY